MRNVPPAAAAQHGVFTRQQALAAGWSPSALRHGVDAGRLQRLAGHTYSVVPESAGLDHHLRIRQSAAAAALSWRASAVSSRSAAALLDLPLLTTPDLPCVTVRASRRINAPSTHAHHARLSALDCQAVGQLRCTTAARTIVDVARECGVDEAVVVADAALHRGLTDLASISAAADRCTGWPGINRARVALASARAAAESPLESISRLRLLDIGVDQPVLQDNLFDVDGRRLARTDFYWPQAGVVGEADGMAKYSTVAALRDEKRRQESLEQAGLVVVRWGWADLQPIEPLAGRLRCAVQQGMRRAAQDRRWRTSAELLRT